MSELEIQRQAIRSKSADPERLNVLLDVPIPVTVHDAQGRIVVANDPAARLFGMAGSETLVAQRPEELLANIELASEQGQRITFAELPGPRLLAGLDARDQSVRVGAGPAPRWLRVSARKLRGADPPLAIQAYEETPPPGIAAAEAAEELRLGRSLQTVALALSSERDHDQLVQRITDEATSICGAKFGAFFHNVERENGGKYLLYTLSGAPREAFEKFGHPRATPVFAPTFHGERPVRSDDIRQDPRYGKMGPHHGMPRGHLPVVSYLAVPVVSASGDVLGGLFFGHPEPGRFTEQHERAVSAIAAHAAIALDTAKLLGRVRSNETRLAAERTRFAELLEQAPAAIAVLRGADHVYEIANPHYLRLVNRDRSLIGKPLRDAFPEVADQRVYEAFDRVFATGEPFSSSEMEVHFRGSGDQIEQVWVAFTITPIREADVVIGVMCVAIDVSPQVRSRLQLEQLTAALMTSERRFRSLVEASSQMVWTTSASGEVLDDSPSWRTFTGQSYDEWRGFGWLDAVHPEDREQAAQAWRAAVAERRRYEVEYRVRRSDGSYAHTMARGTPLLGDDGEIEQWIGLNFDISERVRAEETLREQERKLRLALEAGRLGTWEFDITSARLYWSPQLERIHGIPVGSFEQSLEAYQRLIHPEDKQLVVQAIGEDVQLGRDHRLLYRIVRGDGAVRWLETFGTFIPDANGNPSKLLGVCTDVTERRAAQEAQNALRIQRMLEGISDSFAVYDHDWTTLFANAASTARLGLLPSQVIGKKLWELLPETRGTKLEQELNRVLRTGESSTFEEYHAPLARWYEVHAYSLPEIGVAVYSRDVTERRREEQLKQRVARYGQMRAEIGAALSTHRDLTTMLQRCCQAIVDHLDLACARVWLADPDGATLELCASAGTHTHDDGAHARIPVGVHEIGRVAAQRRAYLTNDVPNDPFVSDREWARRAGLHAFAGYPLIVDDALVGVIAVFATEVLASDTLVALAAAGDAIAQGVERRRAELDLAEHARELARSNADLEQFAYVASHDLQEPLRMVGSYVQLLERRYKDHLDDDARDFIGFAVEGVTRMQRLIEDLLTYSRVGARAHEPEPVSMDAVLAVVEQNLASAIADSGAAVTHDPLPLVHGDRGQLVHLLQNLVGNAIKFRGEEPPRVHVSARREGGEWSFSVADNGIGIDPQYHERIFVIFQRLNSRERYPGTGIGLAIAKKIVERHGGGIWIESSPGRGTTVRFTLPAAALARKVTP